MLIWRYTSYILAFLKMLLEKENRVMYSDTKLQKENQIQRMQCE